MKYSIGEMLSFCKQLVASMLSVTLLINLSAPLAAQSLVPLKVSSGLSASEQQTTKRLAQAVEQRAFEAVRESTRVDTSLKKENFYSEDAEFRFLEDMEKSFLHPEQKNLLNQEQDVRAQFMKQYQAAVDEQIASAEKELQKYEEKLRTQKDSILTQAALYEVSSPVLSAWSEDAEKQIRTSVAVSRAKINKWRTQAKQNAEAVYQELLEEAKAESKDAAEEDMKALRAQLEELFALYKKNPVKARPYLINISVTLLLTAGRMTTLFTPEEKAMLHSLYADELEKNTSCYDKQLSARGCQVAINAVSGLGILGDEYDARLVSEFVQKVMVTPYASMGILTGVSTLLAMQAYTRIGNILEIASRKEGEVNREDSDALSIRTWVKTIHDGKGRYLGEVSKYAQFPEKMEQVSNDPAQSNAWEEVAYMLAEDGSPSALALLRDYGINKCEGYATKSFKLNTDAGIACTGIKPFLVGALRSGKYGEYSGSSVVKTAHGELRSSGAAYIDQARIQADKARRDEQVALARQAASAKGLNIAAYIARQLFLRGKGTDMNSASGWLLDTKLYEIFERETNHQANLDEALRLTMYSQDSEIYKAKQRSQHRVDTWLKIGTYGDIAIIVICMVDLIKAAPKLVVTGRDLYKVTKMARRGEAMEARIAFLRRSQSTQRLLKWRAIPAKIKNGMEASVSNLLPQFTNTKPLLKPIPSVMQAALPTVTLGADMNMAVNANTVTGMLGNTPAVNARLASLQNTLNLATERTNFALETPNKLARFFGQQDAQYRYRLSKEILAASKKYSRADQAAMADFAAAVKKNRNIVMPQYLKDLPKQALIDTTAGKVDFGVLRGVVSPILGTLNSSTEGLFSTALAEVTTQTNLEFAHRSWFSQKTMALFGGNKKKYKGMLADNIIKLIEKDNVLPQLSFTQREKVFTALAANVRRSEGISVPADITKYAAMKYDKAPVSFRTVPGALFAPASNGSTRLPLQLNVDTSIKGIKNEKVYQRVIFTKRGKDYFMGLTDGISQPSNLGSFKVDISKSELPTLIRGAAEANLGTNLELKLSPYSSVKAFRQAAAISGESTAGVGATFADRARGLWASRRSKTKIWTDELPVFIRHADGSQVAVPILIKADKQLRLAGSSLVLGADNYLSLMRNGEKVASSKLWRFSLPKQQITNLVELAKANTFDRPLNLTLRSGKNKILPLFWTSGLSLSAASSGLITPLETTYRDQISEGQKTAITFVFPYLPSLLSPAISPFIMKYGSAKVLRVSLATVATGLAFSAAMGFRGNLDPTNPPPVWPLIATAGAIGFSSAMSRSTLNVLIDSMGGGGSLLKSMAFKNLGSVFLLAPSFVWGAIKLHGVPAVTGKKLTQEELSKPATDFSLAFPLLTVATLGVLGWVKSARLDSSIGRASAVLKGEKFPFWKEMGVAWKTTFAPEVLPLSAATFAFTGFEAAAFSKGTNLSLKPMYEQTGIVKNSVPGNRANTLAMLTGITAAAVPFLIRLGAKASIKALDNPADPAIAYKRMLGLSYGFNTAGGLMLMSYGLNPKPLTNENGKLQLDPRMIAGIIMMGLGTANTTQSFQKLANIRIGSGVTVAKMTANMDKAAAAARAKELKTMTMTSFSWSQFGIAALPGLQGIFVDREKAMNIRPANGPLSVLWIPITALGVSIGLGLYGIYPVRLPSGLLGLTKLALDGYKSYNPVQYANQFMEMRSHDNSGQLGIRVHQYLEHEKEKQEAAAQKAKAAEEKAIRAQEKAVEAEQAAEQAEENAKQTEEELHKVLM